MAAPGQKKNLKEAPPMYRRRSSPDGSISARTVPANSKMKKSASEYAFASNSRPSYPLQEEMKLTSGADHLCPGTTLTPGGVGKKKDSLHSSFTTSNQEESISSAIKDMLQPYTKSPQTNLEEINKKVSQIYDIVGRAVSIIIIIIINCFSVLQNSCMN